VYQTKICLRPDLFFMHIWFGLLSLNPNNSPKYMSSKLVMLKFELSSSTMIGMWPVSMTFLPYLWMNNLSFWCSLSISFCSLLCNLLIPQVVALGIVIRHTLSPYLDYVSYLFQRMDPLPEQEHFEVSILCGRSTVMPLIVRVFVDLDFSFMIQINYRDFLQSPLQVIHVFSSPNYFKSVLL
jgi:hypothetical protein